MSAGFSIRPRARAKRRMQPMSSNFTVRRSPSTISAAYCFCDMAILHRAQTSDGSISAGLGGPWVHVASRINTRIGTVFDIFEIELLECGVVSRKALDGAAGVFNGAQNRLAVLG